MQKDKYNGQLSPSWLFLAGCGTKKRFRNKNNSLLFAAIFAAMMYSLA